MTMGEGGMQRLSEGGEVARVGRGGDNGGDNGGDSDILRALFRGRWLNGSCVMKDEGFVCYNATSGCNK
jgi:hypothetical protein